MDLHLRAPMKDDLTAIAEYKAEFTRHNEVLHGCACIENYSDLADWLNVVQKNAKKETVAEGWVPSSTLLAIREDGLLVGMIDIRHQLNDYLSQFGGHIGYSIRRSQRQKGYATRMLQLGLDYARSLNLERVLITCDKNNIASAATIRSQNGALENEVVEDGHLIQRYWITL